MTNVPSRDDGGLDFGATIRGFAAGQQLFDRYKLKEILGRGGMGIVWHAFDEQLERDVALKFLPELVAFDETAIADLKRETKKSQELRHDHIVQVYDFVSNKENACISMEYVDGPTLSAIKARKESGFLEVDEIKGWIEQLCEALAYAHQRARIVHRDLKPPNLMVNSRNELKVTDFGIARSVSDSVSMLTMVRGTSGTLVYMSPQQLGGQRASHLDDVYSVGVTIYELLTGKPPFYSGDVTDQVKNAVPASMQERRFELGVSGSPIPKNWEETVAACLAKDPGQRPESASEVAQRLGLSVPHYGAPTPVVVDAKSAPARSMTESSQRRDVIVGAVMIIALVAAGLGWYFGMHLPAERARKAEESRAIAQRSEEEAKTKEAEHLANARGAVLINTEPSGATVTLGDETRESPATFNKVKIGALPFKVTLKNYEPVEQQIEVKEGEIANPGVIKLTRSTGSAQIDSTPQGIDFDLEDAEGKHHTGRTPQSFVDLPAGPGQVTYKPERAGPHTDWVVVVAHQNSAFSWKAPEVSTEVAVASPSPVNAATPRASATPQPKRSFAGTWTGSGESICTGPSGPPDKMTMTYTIRISANEKTIHTSWNTLTGGSGFESAADRSGDTLRWSFRQGAGPSGPGTWTSSCSLTLTGANAARFSRVTRFTTNPGTCKFSNSLSR